MSTMKPPLSYSKNESDLMFENFEIQFKDIKKDIKDGFEGVHKRQDIANGRISKNEKFIYTAMGGLSVITAIVIPLLIYVFNQNMSIGHQLESVLSSYEVIVE